MIIHAYVKQICGSLSSY